MRILIVLLLFLSTGMAADSTGVLSLLPDPDFSPGWNYDFEPEVYGPDNLFEYINGEAELYKDYEFKIMATASYLMHTDPALSFTVDIYDMRTALNAFGVYSTYRQPDLTFADIGREAALSELTIRFYKGKYFVQLNAGSLEDTVNTVMRTQAGAIAGRVPELPLPEELKRLPKSKRVPHSLTFVTKGFLGQEAFGPVLHAQYTLEDQTCIGFAALFESADRAHVALDQFKQNLGQRDIQVSDWNDGITADLPYQGHIVIRPTGTMLIGAYKADDLQPLKTLSSMIEEHVRKSVK